MEWLRCWLSISLFWFVRRLQIHHQATECLKYSMPVAVITLIAFGRQGVSAWGWPFALHSYIIYIYIYIYIYIVYIFIYIRGLILMLIHDHVLCSSRSVHCCSFISYSHTYQLPSSAVVFINFINCQRVCKHVHKECILWEHNNNSIKCLMCVSANRFQGVYI